MLPASMAPSALPAPTMVWISSMKTMMRPSSLAMSRSTAFSAPRTRPVLGAGQQAGHVQHQHLLALQGFRHLAVDDALGQAFDDGGLADPGSPISTGLFLVRRCRIWMARRISSSRPITGSSLPWAARSVRSMQYFFSASRCPSASWESDALPAPYGVDRGLQRLAVQTVLPGQAADFALSSARARRNISLAMNWSPASGPPLSVRLSRLPRSRPTETSPP